MTGTKLRRFMMNTGSICHNIDNTTSPADMGRFFRLLAHNELVSSKVSTVMKTILGRQQFTGAMTLFLPTETHAEHRTGSLPGSVLNVGLAYYAKKPLILCLMATQLDNTGEGAMVLGRVVDLICTAGKE